VTKPAARLSRTVDVSRAIATGHPSIETERKKISGSIVGEPIQKAITGASGTPPSSSELIMGITVQEQKGLNAPAAVAKRTAATGRALNAPRSLSASPDRRRITASGMLTKRKGQIRRRLSPMDRPICAS